MAVFITGFLGIRMFARNLNWTETGVSGEAEDGLMRSNALEESLIDFDDAASQR